VEGFFDPIMQRIPFEGVRERFREAILEKMDGAGLTQVSDDRKGKKQ
jgi:hypothetical protein